MALVGGDLACSGAPGPSDAPVIATSTWDADCSALIAIVDKVMTRFVMAGSINFELRSKLLLENRMEDARGAAQSSVPPPQRGPLTREQQIVEYIHAALHVGRTDSCPGTGKCFVRPSGRMERTLAL